MSDTEPTITGGPDQLAIAVTGVGGAARRLDRLAVVAHAGGLGEGGRGREQRRGEREEEQQGGSKNGAHPVDSLSEGRLRRRAEYRRGIDRQSNGLERDARPDRLAARQQASATPGWHDRRGGPPGRR